MRRYSLSKPKSIKLGQLFGNTNKKVKALLLCEDNSHNLYVSFREQRRKGSKTMGFVVARPKSEHAEITTSQMKLAEAEAQLETLRTLGTAIAQERNKLERALAYTAVVEAMTEGRVDFSLSLGGRSFAPCLS